MDVQKLINQYKQVDILPKEIQYVQMKDYLQANGWYDRSSIDILIGKMENECNRQNSQYSISFGLSYPAILFLVSTIMTLLGIFSLDNLEWFGGIAFFVAILMIVTSYKLKPKTRNNDLINLLYDFKKELM